MAHDGTLLDHVDCPQCRGRPNVAYFAGQDTDGSFLTKPCGKCGGLGKLSRDHPDLDLQQCPHCGHEVEVSELCMGEADACPHCEEPFFRDFHGDLVAMTWDEVRF